MTSSFSIEYRRAAWFTVILLILNLVGDGWSGRPGPLAHQVLLLPFALLFAWAMFKFLSPLVSPGGQRGSIWTPRRALLLVFFFELLTVCLFLYEKKHFASVGYKLNTLAAAAIFVPACVMLNAIAIYRAPRPALVFAATMYTYAAGMLLAIASFPLTYLRSDMLPVILWADTNLLHRINPYALIYVGDRVYAFPYLPGMLVAYLPVVVLHIDLRFATMTYLLAAAALAFWAARSDRRLEVAALLALFVLCPFLGYRHELYLQAHWFFLMLAFVLMQRRHFAWAAVVFGISMAIYQFSWIMFPFMVLHGLRRRGRTEALKLALLGGVGALVVMGPFLSSALHQIANNTVTQWGKVPHAVADPINLSYWVTYVIRPNQLLRLQAVLMIAIFGYCFFRNRCTDLTDTVRWMVVALAVFIPLTVFVDGYFYFLLLFVMLVFTCVANGWWREPAGPAGVGEFSARR